MNKRKPFTKLFNLFKALTRIKIGVEVSPKDVMRLFELLQAKKIKAMAKALESVVKQPKTPIHYILKAFYYDEGIVDMQAPCGVTKLDTHYKNIFYNTFETIDALRMGARLYVLPPIISDVYYFQNRIQADRYLAYVQRHRPETYVAVKKKYLIGEVTFKRYVKDLLDKYVDASIKGLKMFRKRTYNVESSLRLIQGSLLEGYCNYPKVKKSKNYTLTRLKSIKKKMYRTQHNLDPLTTSGVAIPTLNAQEIVDMPSIANLPTLVAEATA